MAKSKSSGRPTPPVSPLAAAIGELTANIRQLSATMAPVASGFGKPQVPPTAYTPFDFTPAAPGTQLARPAPEVLTPDGEQPKPKKKEKEPEAADWTETATKVNDASRKVLGGFQSIASLGGSPASAISAIGGQIGKLTANMGPQAAAVGQLVSTVAQLPTLFQSAASSINSYVSAFSPMASSRFQRAGADLMASIGENLLPILNAATDVVRWFGDSVAGLTPIIKPVIQWVMNAFRPFGQLIGDVFRELLTEGVLFAEAFAPLAKLFAEISMGPLQVMVAGMRGMLEVIRNITRGVAGMLGLKMPEFDGSSVGKSAQQASFTNSDDLWRKMVETTVNQGRAAPEQEVPNLLKAIEEKLRNLPGDFARALAVELDKRKNNVVNNAQGKVGEVAPYALTSPFVGLLSDLVRGQVLKRN